MLNSILDLIEKLNFASERYYNYGDSPLSDEQFDLMLNNLKALEKQTGIIMSNSPTQKVGAIVLPEIKKTEMIDKPMLSLGKVHSQKEIDDFSRGQTLVGSIKCDGLSVRLIYENGKLISANTRGTGTIGADITEHIKYFENVPISISKTDRIIIDGEAIIKIFDFAIINKNNEFKNPRNAAAGALNNLDMKEVKKRKLSFIGWDIIEGGPNDFYRNRLVELEKWGFEAVYWSTTATNELILDFAEATGIPCDGVVWRIDDIQYGETLGQTSHHFNNAVAWKPPIATKSSNLIDIEWTMGRTGALTPVAQFKPIDFDGALIERASLHNLSIMFDLLGEQPYKNQKVDIYRANMIIPQIFSAENLIENAEVITIPDICPICGGETTRICENESEVLFCTNPNCEGKLINRLDHFAGKKGLDIKGLSKATLEKVIDWGWVTNAADIFSLKDHAEEWYSKPSFGFKSVDRLLNSIEESKNVKFVDFLSAIGIPLIGKSMSKLIIKYSDTYEDFRDKVNNKWDFSQIDGIGPEKSESILTFDYSEADKISKLLNFITETKEEVEETLSGKTIVVTGSLKTFKNRAALVEEISKRGGKVVGSISKNTDILINNDEHSTSSKNVAAKKLGIPIVSEENFIKNFLTF